MNRFLSAVLLLLSLVIAESFGLPDDLLRGTVTAIAQGPEGFLWVGMQNGLYRFDGHELVRYRPDGDSADESGLADAHITTALTTSDGRLFVGTRRRGFFAYHDSSRSFRGVELRTEPEDPPFHITAICEDLTAKIPAVWIGTSNNGVLLLSEDNTVVRRFRHQPFDPRAIPSDRVAAILQMPSGEIWVGTADRGIGVLDSGLEKFELLQSRFGTAGTLPSNNISTLTLDDQRRIWVGTVDAGVVYASATDPVFSRPPNWPSELTNVHVTAIRATPEGEVWIATDGGGLVTLADKAIVTRRDASTGLGSDRSISLYQDRGGLLWVGLFGAGLRMFTPTNFATVPCALFAAGSPTIVWALAEADDGSIWIGTDASGLFRWDRDGNQCQPVPIVLPGRNAANPPRIYAVEADNRGRIWVGFADDGIVAFDEKGATVARLAYAANGTGLVTDKILSLEAASDGSLWVGTDGSGLLRVGPSGDQRLFPSAGAEGYPGGLVVYDIMEAAGHIWIGSSSGNLNEYDPETARFTIHDLSSGGAPPVVWSIEPDTDGTLLLGTIDAGVMRFAPATGEIERLGGAGLGGNRGLQVYAAIPDSQGTVWVSTNDGLYSIDPHISDRFVRQALLTQEFSFNASLRGSDDSIYFGGVGGVTRLDPDGFQSDSYTPSLVYSSISVPSSGRQLLAREREANLAGEPTHEVVLPGTVREIAITVSTLDFAAPERIGYRTQLVGRDRQWVEAGSRRTFAYTDLHPGDHVLKINSTNRDGAWTDQVFALLLVVKPRFWEHRSSQTAAALLVAMAFGLISIQVISRQEWKTVRAAEEGEERARQEEQKRNRAAQRRSSETVTMVRGVLRDNEIRQHGHSAVKMAPYIEGVVAELLGIGSGSDESRLAVYTAVEDIHLSSPLALGCGLIIGELLVTLQTPERDGSRMLVGLNRIGDACVLTVAGTERSRSVVDAKLSSLAELIAQIDGTPTVHADEDSWFGRGFDLQVTLSPTTE